MTLLFILVVFWKKKSLSDVLAEYVPSHYDSYLTIQVLGVLHSVYRMILFVLIQIVYLFICQVQTSRQSNYWVNLGWCTKFLFIYI
jgi:hypothetical protein